MVLRVLRSGLRFSPRLLDDLNLSNLFRAKLKGHCAETECRDGRTEAHETYRVLGEDISLMLSGSAS